jgi:hypothetical protein
MRRQQIYGVCPCKVEVVHFPAIVALRLHKQKRQNLVTYPGFFEKRLEIVALGEEGFVDQLL